jgi:hypothetical protein
MDHPVTVIEDRGDVLAVWLEPGSRFDFHEHPIGPHPWSGATAWGDTQVLQLHRSGDLYSVWNFFSSGVFTHWYINFEAAVVRRANGSKPMTTDSTWSSLPRDMSPGKTSII